VAMPTEWIPCVCRIRGVGEGEYSKDCARHNMQAEEAYNRFFQDWIGSLEGTSVRHW